MATPNDAGPPAKRCRLSLLDGGRSLLASPPRGRRWPDDEEQQKQQRIQTSVTDEDEANLTTTALGLEAVPIFEKLPTDLLAMSFFGGYVDSLQVLKISATVSKETAQIALKTVKLLDLRALGNLTPERLSQIVSRFHYVTEVDLGSSPLVFGEHLLRLVPWAKTLKSLRLKGTSVSDRDIMGYLEASTQYLGGEPTVLEELDLSATARHFSNNVGDEAIASIVANCPNLHTLKLGWCKKITDKSVKRLKSLTRLTTLDLSLTFTGDEGCRDLFHIKSLKHLDLSATRITGEGLVNLLQGDHHADRPPQLESLVLRHIDKWIYPETLALLSSLPLKHLNVEYSKAAKHDAVLRTLKENGITVIGAKASS